MPDELNSEALHYLPPRKLDSLLLSLPLIRYLRVTLSMIALAFFLRV